MAGCLLALNGAWSSAAGRGGGGERAGAAGERAQAACTAYQRARSRLRRSLRASRARAARTPPRARRRLERAGRAERLRLQRRVRRLGRRCSAARRPSTRTPQRRAAPAPPPEVSAGADGVRFGLHANRWGRGPEGPSELDRMKSFGVRWLREEFDALPDAETDTLYLEAARRGLRILPLLQTGNTLPADVGAFAGVVSAFARRFGPGGAFWTAHPELDGSLASTHFEIYNEPYGDWYGPVEPARYAALLRTVVPRAREANPSASFMMAVDRTPGGERHTWIDDLYAAEPALNSYFDAVAMHPYSGNRAPDKPDDPWGFARIAEARRALEAHGAGDKSFWITEVGWSTCPGDPEWCVSEAEQAANMERLAELVQSRYTFVDAVFYYHFVGNERDPGDAEDFFGILHADFSPKPAYHALRRITGAG